MGATCDGREAGVAQSHNYTGHNYIGHNCVRKCLRIHVQKHAPGSRPGALISPRGAMGCCCILISKNIRCHGALLLTLRAG